MNWTIPTTFKYKSQQLVDSLKKIYWALTEPDVPMHVKLLLWLIIAYVLSPIDLIPDFIPILGLLDEIILVPIMVTLVIKLIPDHVVQYQHEQPIVPEFDKYFSIVGFIMVLFLWVVIFSAVLITIF